ncbi:hypothetical protein C0674_00570 [Sporolactobacillus terrae]|uniref:Uncharacterized protein n=1 Tax=Sporolactobacillus terrae TaxID=269673 RepID=A0A410D574_9BACL|nr:hypothetical protein C0674_00570 [Sporolactobacillus terrae]QAA24222.1 hypothetical protein C0679_00550 [Sporolactobacillus terrae]BBN97390.1 hypothetical protein St703_00950 [Sporolactobacillus terrae]
MHPDRERGHRLEAAREADDRIAPLSGSLKQKAVGEDGSRRYRHRVEIISNKVEPRQRGVFVSTGTKTLF